MSRPRRQCVIGIPQHVIQRGNNRTECFREKLDYAFFIHCLREASAKFCVDIHAWVLMTNHVHLLVTPRLEMGVSRMMQDIGRRYVLYFNHIHHRTGTLWEGRFRSSMVSSRRYMLACYRYIELNPVRAGMVEHPADYLWSSYQHNARGKPSSLITHHGEYLALGNTSRKRIKRYRAMVDSGLDASQLDAIRKSVNSGATLGVRTS